MDGIVTVDGKQYRLVQAGWTHDGVKMIFQSPTRRWLEKGETEGYHNWYQVWTLEEVPTCGHQTVFGPCPLLPDHKEPHTGAS